MFLWILSYSNVFYMFIQRLITKFVFDDTDMGPYQPLGTSPIQRRGEVAPVPQWEAGDYQAVEQNLEGLTTDIPDMPLGEVPWCDQRHTVGVSDSMGRLIRRVAWTVMCYREHHPWHHFVEAMSFRFWHFGLRTTLFVKNSFDRYIYRRLLLVYLILCEKLMWLIYKWSKCLSNT